MEILQALQTAGAITALLLIVFGSQRLKQHLKCLL